MQAQISPNQTLQSVEEIMTNGYIAEVAYENAAKYLDDVVMSIKRDDRFNRRLEHVTQYYPIFQDKFSISKLKEIKKDKCLKELFRLFSELGSLNNSNPSNDMGHIGQYSNNLPFYESNGTIRVGKGMLQKSEEIITGSQAQELAFSFRNQLVECLEYINSNLPNTVDDFKAMENYLVGKLGLTATHGWMHKLLHMYHPERFSQLHTKDFRETTLKYLEVKPDPSFYGMAGQLYEIQKRMNEKNWFTINTLLYEDEGWKKFKANSNATFSNIVSTGEYDNWQVLNGDTVMIDLSPEEMEDCDAAIPSEVVPFFNDDGNSITLLYGKDRLSGDLLGEEDNKLHLVWDIALLNKMSECTAGNSDQGVVALLEKSKKGEYKIQFFPGKENPIKIPEDEDEQEQQAHSLTTARLEKIAVSRQEEAPLATQVKTNVYKRDKYITEYARRRANGICGLCKSPAPFTNQDGTPYLDNM